MCSTCGCKGAEDSDISKNIFGNMRDAKKRAKQLGTKQIHSHDLNGDKVFMPFKTHQEYQKNMRAESFEAEYSVDKLSKMSFTEIDRKSGFLGDMLANLGVMDSWAELSKSKRKEILNKIKKKESWLGWEAESYEAEVAYAVMWEDVRRDMKYPKEDDNEGLIYGIEYMDGDEVSDVEWFSTKERRDGKLKSYIKEFGKKAESFDEDDDDWRDWGEGMTIPQMAKALSKMSWDEVDEETGYGDDLFDWFNKWDKKSQKERETYALRVLKESYEAESFEAEYSVDKLSKMSFTEIDRKSGFLGDMLANLGVMDSWAELSKSKRKEILNKIKKKESWLGWEAESNFDKLANKIAAQYRAKGKSPAEAERIGKATAAKIGVKKYGKAGMRRKAMRGRMAKGAEGSMPKKSIIPNVIIFGVLGVTAYLATKIKSVEFGADGDCGCGCKGAKVGGCGDTKKADEGHYPETFDPVQDWLPRYRYPEDSDWSNSYNPADPYRPLDYQTVQVDSKTTVDKMGMI